MSIKNSFSELKKNPVALAVFAIGILAFIYVCILAVKILTGGGAAAPKVIEISQNEINNFKNTEVKTDNQEETKQQKAKRQKNIKERDITGAWDSYLGNTRVLLQLKDGVFRLIMISRDTNNTRYYINGVYRMEEDILYFDPDPTSPPPKGDFEYEILTRADFPVMVSKHKGKMVWLKPSKDVDIYVPNYHVIIDRSINDIVVWSVLK